MKILLTGASGFLGKIISPILSYDHRIVSIGRAGNNIIQADLSAGMPEIPAVDAVIHAAGKAHVYPKTDEEKQAFFSVNVHGTENLLMALSKHNLQAFVFISSVSVYGLEQGANIEESSPLLGKSPYALSKIQSEALVEAWCTSRGIDYLILRLPLIVGKNPLGNLKKMVDGIQQKRYLRIAKGDAQKSAVLATDVAFLIQAWLNDSNRKSGIFNLTDGKHPTFYQLEEALKTMLHVQHIPTIPGWLGYFLGRIGDYLSFFPVNSSTIKKITCSFTFSDQKARKELGWTPRSVLDNLHELNA